MLNVGFGEMAFIGLIAMIIFGPKRLPEIARSAGKFIRQFQSETSRAMSDLKEGLEPINVGIFDEPDAAPAAMEPVTDAPARPLATTRRKTSTSPKRRAATTRSAPAKKSAAKRPTAKRPTAKRPARRTSVASKPRRRA